jgi:hypothetical protein
MGTLVDLTPDTVCTGTTIEIFQNGAYPTGEHRPSKLQCHAQSRSGVIQHQARTVQFGDRRHQR